MSLVNALVQVKADLKACCDELIDLRNRAATNQSRIEELRIELHLIEEALEKYRGQVEQLNRN